MCIRPYLSPLTVMWQLLHSTRGQSSQATPQLFYVGMVPGFQLWTLQGGIGLTNTWCLIIKCTPQWSSPQKVYDKALIETLQQAHCESTLSDTTDSRSRPWRCLWFPQVLILASDLPEHTKKCPPILHGHHSPPERNAKPLWPRTSLYHSTQSQPILFLRESTEESMLWHKHR